MEKLNDWMTLIANVGVLAGIVFLAFEIRVNTEAVKAESTANYASTTIGAISSEPMEALIKIDAEGWRGVPTESRQIARNRTLSLLKSGEHAFVQWTAGSLDTRLWEGNDRGMYQFLWNARFARDSWQAGVRHNFSTEYQQYIDAMIDDICTRRVCNELPDWAAPDPDLLSGMQAWMSRS